jgi:CCR4-NOT transcription complex subunit 1
MSLQTANNNHKELAEQAANLVAQENIELACAFIQKTAIEKAIVEIDKRLANVRIFSHTFLLILN